MRDYGLPPLVWDEPEGGCAHEWGGEERGRRKDMLPLSESTSMGRVGTTAVQGVGPPSGGHFCLRSGCWRGSLGLEPTPDLYVQHLVQVFREVRRVLRPDGTCWVVLGDSYANDGKWGGSTSGKHVAGLHGNSGIGRGQRTTDLKPKDLILIPARVALALQADGWWIRSEIVWAKGLSFCAAYAGSVMPESVQDRPTRAHETVFLLTHAERYYYDAEAVKERSAEPERGPRADRFGGNKHGAATTKHSDGSVWTGDVAAGRNLRSVWAINPEAFPEAHFATFPRALVTPMILAGASEAGACARCGTPWARVVDRPLAPKELFTKRNAPADGRVYSGSIVDGDWVGMGQKLATWRSDHPSRTLGWRPTCACGPEAGRRPCIVLDPFAGSGTVPLVAQELGRVGLGVDLKPEYLAMAGRRTAQQVLALEAPAPATEQEEFRL